MAASAKSRRACGPSFVFLASTRSCDALKSPRNDTGIDMTNLHRSPPMNQSETDLGIVNESQLLRFGISHSQSELTRDLREKLLLDVSHTFRENDKRSEPFDIMPRITIVLIIGRAFDACHDQRPCLTAPNAG